MLILKKQNGMSLIELLVAIGVMSVLMFSMMTLNFTQQNQIKSMSQKLESISIEKNLQRILLSDGDCSCIFSGITWNTKQSIPMGKLKSGCSNSIFLQAGNKYSETQTNLKVSSISLSNPITLANGNVSADLVVDYDPSTLAGPLHSTKIPKLEFVLVSGKIDSCVGMSTIQQLCQNMGGTWSANKCSMTATFPAASQTCPSGQAVTGFKSDGTPQCSTVVAAVSSTNGQSPSYAVSTNCDKFSKVCTISIVGATPGGPLLLTTTNGTNLVNNANWATADSTGSTSISFVYSCQAAGLNPPCTKMGTITDKISGSTAGFGYNMNW